MISFPSTVTLFLESMYLFVEYFPFFAGRGKRGRGCCFKRGGSPGSQEVVALDLKRW